MYHEWIKVLNTSLLFRGINPDALDTMLNCLNPVIQRCKQREIVALYGQPFHGIGIVVSGSIALTKESYHGDRIILEILNAGGVFGEVIAFSDSKIWTITVITQEDSCLLFLPQGKITGNCSSVCPAHNLLITNMMKILSERTLTLNRKIEHLSAKSIRGKVSSYFLDMYRQTGKTVFAVPMKRFELADYLNIPRPSLSREMGLMRDSGIIDFNGSSIEIKNVFILEESIR
ncbi:MAG: Crp/Fnr family transcriptional regulator [Dehalococcoidales bacterium]|nr:Crp/Fnr family transcriptional regulator [Dehalococcoidales bacterium]